MKQYLYKNEDSFYFWVIMTEEKYCITKYGKIGTEGIFIIQKFKSDLKAINYFNLQIKNKKRKGYSKKIDYINGNIITLNGNQHFDQDINFEKIFKENEIENGEVIINGNLYVKGEVNVTSYTLLVFGHLHCDFLNCDYNCTIMGDLKMEYSFEQWKVISDLKKRYSYETFEEMKIIYNPKKIDWLHLKRHTPKIWKLLNSI